MVHYNSTGERLYVGGYYQYREMPHRQLTCVRAENIDFLPPTMYSPIIKVTAPNKRVALQLIKDNLK